MAKSAHLCDNILGQRLWIWRRTSLVSSTRLCCGICLGGGVRTGRSVSAITSSCNLRFARERNPRELTQPFSCGDEPLGALLVRVSPELFGKRA